MYTLPSKLDTPKDFNFPYQPYEIQQKFMESLYTVLEQGSVGIFESPTGTGKTLTLVCGVLKWFQDYEALAKQGLKAYIEKITKDIKQLGIDETTNKWVRVDEVMRKEFELRELCRLKDLMLACQLKLQEIKDRRPNPANATPVRGEHEEDPEHKKSDDQALLSIFKDVAETKCPLAITGELQELLTDVKIYFSSRTHGQLKQVVQEFKRTAYSGSVRCVSLASRQQLCINPEIRHQRSAAQINDGCLALQNCVPIQSSVCGSDRCRNCSSGVATCDNQKKPRMEKSSTCPFISGADIEELSKEVLCKVYNVEDLVLAGERTRTCPYYTLRQINRYAQLIVLPYPLLLHHKSRKDWGIDLNHAVVIIDEAHNLLDTIAQVYSEEVTLHQLTEIGKNVNAYKEYYAASLGPEKYCNINKLLTILDKLNKVLTTSSPSPEAAESPPAYRIMNSDEFLGECELCEVGIFGMIDYFVKERLIQKLQGFAKYKSKNKHTQKPQCADTSSTEVKIEVKDSVPEDQINQTEFAIRPLFGFLETVLGRAADGRILITFDENPINSKRALLKYIVLNPGQYFETILQQSRAIVIAGGTMQPTKQLTEQLFKSCPERVVENFYDHVVPADAVLPIVVAEGPTGKRLCFNYARRAQPEMLSELGMTLQNLCWIIPAGVVCFFPSYDFLETVYVHLQKHGYLEKISQRKRLFWETQVGAKRAEQMLNEYSTAARTKGALLFAVVGGKFSEGLNFTDDLGRCVVVVGMPYPNLNSPELIERMKYLNGTLGAGAGNEYYGNLCVKAINQCIGRCLRHMHDYASVMLLDERYENGQIQQKLPAWIRRNLKNPRNFGIIQSITAKFFKKKKQS